MKITKKSGLIGIASFCIVLFTMPIGHGLMILMEHYLKGAMLNYVAFGMGLVGLIMTLYGISAKGDTKQTLWGLFGGLLYWTGWIEFIFVYYSHRFGVQPLMENGEVVTKPEYLIMPSSFGFWVMFLLLYIFSIQTGCDFINWVQRLLRRNHHNIMKVKPIARHISVVTFLELNLILWTSYLLLLFIYDKNFIGDHNPITLIIGFACLIGSFFMFPKLLRYQSWGPAIRYAIPTVIVFWTFVEVMGRKNFLREIWVEPIEYKVEMISLLVCLVLLVLYVIIRQSYHKKA
ncbi:hypothetical protein [Porphyromonas pogonae]|uniref:hypothetical protein n=1 Tax=Porphyromonas pogonae TaxID=867595 RepID=UPI002E77908E|nr:hypothetical protein [Porphyromonas pogonae]